MTPPSQEVTQLLVAWSNGDSAALDRLIPLVHEELRRLANRYMRQERRRDHHGVTLQTTALVNEAYLRLIDARNVQWESRAHFFAMADSAAVFGEEAGTAVPISGRFGLCAGSIVYFIRRATRITRRMVRTDT